MVMVVMMIVTDGSGCDDDSGSGCCVVGTRKKIGENTWEYITMTGNTPIWLGSAGRAGGQSEKSQPIMND